MPAYVRRTLAELCAESQSAILGQLSAGNARARFPIAPEQIEAWQFQLEPLQRAAAALIAQVPGASDWAVLLEYPIPRIGKRIDAVLLMRDILAVLEFKTGTARTSAVAQVEDYSEMLRNFHEPSQAINVIPVAVYAREEAAETTELGDGRRCISTSFANLGTTLFALWKRFSRSSSVPIEPAAWDVGRFVPIPSIVEAAVSLYSGKSVFEIDHACAAHESLQSATQAIVSAVDMARNHRRKLVVFVTGVPGAGKTLVGLNAAHHSSINACTSFLSGNRPLILVLKEALVRDVVARQKLSKKRAKQVIETFIHNVHRFADEFFDNSVAPAQHVIIFDEAQRAWNLEQNSKKYERSCSEPEMLLSIMHRHPDWAVIVALVGGGQEINRGEAGLSEWGNALLKHPEWQIWSPPQALAGDSAVAGQRLFTGGSPPGITTIPELHLEVSLRSLRSKHTAEWVNALLAGDARKISSLAVELHPKPILTRSLVAAKEWLKSKRTGSSRAGLVASASAARLRADGLEPSYDFHRFFDWENWFLDIPEDDARSSSMLEVHATQFEIQGLELDWIGLCWGDDLVWDGSQWLCYRFNNRTWRPLTDPEKQRFLVNAYRVLLTRARQGMIIYVPEDREHGFRNSTALDRTAKYLLTCGAEVLGESAGLKHTAPPRFATTRM